MKIKIGFVCSFPMQEEMVKRVCDEFKQKVEVMVKMGVLEGSIPNARRLEEAGVEVVVSWGGTAALLEKNLSIPVVSIKIPDFDIMKAVKQASKFGDKIALMTPKLVNGMELLEELYGVRIKQVVFKNQNDFNYGMIEAFNEGCNVVIGKSYVTLDMAKDYGKKAVLITYNIESIREVFREAIRIANLRRKEREEYTRLETIFNSLSEGVIVTDDLGKITLFNRAAEKILGVKSSSVIGQDASNVLPQMRISKVLKGSGYYEDELYTVGDIGIIATHKPIFLDEGVLGVVSTFREAAEIQKIDSKIRKKLVSKGFVTRYGIDYFSSRSPAMKKVIEKAKKFAATDSNILITGESGTGKEVMAQGIHRLSLRKDKPFVAINCSVLPENLLESELFGYEEGAFTGAKKGGKIGLFETAHGGTLFLDEIGTMHVDLQSKLLRALQEREAMRLGGERIIPVDVRVIAATNLSIENEVKEGHFRKDLYYRISTLTIHMPSLRERKEDIPEIVRDIMEAQFKKFNKKPFKLSKMSLERLIDYPWDGNVRELENILARIVLLCSDNGEARKFIEEELKKVRYSDQHEKEGKGFAEYPVIKKIEVERLINALQECNFNISRAALKLGVSRSTLYRKIRDYNLN